MDIIGLGSNSLKIPFHQACITTIASKTEIASLQPRELNQPTC